MIAEGTIVRKWGIDPLMSKQISLDEHGAIQSDGSECLMVQGEAQRAVGGTAGRLAEIISRCSSDSAIALGALKDGLPSSISITIRRNLKDNPGAITRSRDYIDYRPGLPGWVLIDFDTKGLPPEIAGCIEAAGGMWNALLRVAPGLSRAARVSRASTSSGLFRSDTGAPIPGSNGTHHYVLLQNGSDADPFPSRPTRQVLVARLGLASHWRCWAITRAFPRRSHGWFRRAAVLRRGAADPAAVSSRSMQTRSYSNRR